MLTADQHDAIVDPITELYDEYAQTVINDIARRLASLPMTPTASGQMQRLIEGGKVYDNAIRELSKLTGKSETALREAFQAAGIQATQFDDNIYRAAGLNPLPLNLSPAMLQVLAASLDKTRGLIQNLTMTTATTGRQAFVKAADLAYMQVATGAMSYDQAIRAAIKRVAMEGITVIGYPSGRQDQLDVAMRRAVLTGIAQTTGQLQSIRADEMGQDLVQTSAHIGARPSHEVWQGHIFSRSGKSRIYPPFIESTGFGTVTGICGVNCRHSFYPYFPEISQNAYKQATLNEFKRKRVTYNGKKIPVYEATQIQRSIERKIRSMKRAANALQAAGLGNQPELRAVRQLQAEMRDFIKQTGLVRQRVREQVVKIPSAPAGLTMVSPPPDAIQPVIPPPQVLPSPGAGAEVAPVSAALDLANIKNGDMRSQIDLTLAAIDGVHSDGQLPRIPIKESASRSNYGAFWAEGLRAIKISLTKDGDHQALTLAHELGHFLDFGAMSEKWSSTLAGGEARPVIDAARKSDWMTGLARRFTEFNARGSADVIHITISRRYVNYLVTSKELFARAYAQYIAVKSGSPDLLAQLRALQAAPFPTQWADEDFAPIAAAFDNLFSQKGWLK